MAKKKKPPLPRFVIITTDPKLRAPRTNLSMTVRRLHVGGVPDNWTDIIASRDPGAVDGNIYSILREIVRQEESNGRPPINGDLIVLHALSGKRSEAQIWKVKIKKNLCSFEWITKLCSDMFY